MTGPARADACVCGHVIGDHTDGRRGTGCHWCRCRNPRPDFPGRARRSIPLEPTHVAAIELDDESELRVNLVRYRGHTCVRLQRITTKAGDQFESDTVARIPVNRLGALKEAIREARCRATKTRPRSTPLSFQEPRP